MKEKNQNEELQIEAVNHYDCWCKCNKKAFADNQRLIKKVMFYSIFYAKIFGQFTKKQYLCTRFRAQRKLSAKSQ